MVDTLGDFDLALNGALAELSLPRLERSAIERMVGKGSEHLVRSALAATGGPLQQFDAALAAYQRHYALANGRQATVYPGVEDGLAALQAAGWPLACVTNKPRRFARELLAALGLAPAFAHVYGGDDFPVKKPHPLPLLKACEALGTDPATTLVVGDSTNDAQAARAAGCPVVLVTYGYNHGEPVTTADADGWIDSLAELTRWVRPAV